MKGKRKKSTMGKSRLWFPILLTTVSILLILSPWIVWLAKAESPLHLMVYDKSVSTLPPNQHVALSWFLRHVKIRDPSSKPYRSDLSYRGYHPELDDEQRITRLDPIPMDTDVIYIADTYGVYRDAESIEGERNLIYGGMDQQDVDALRSFLNRDVPNTIIAEYNTLATPTPDYIQNQLYEMFRVRWSGWTGMYVVDLSRKGDAPPWVYAMYEKHTGKSWEYTGSGILLYNTSEEIVVLTEQEDLGEFANRFTYTDIGEQDLSLEGSIPYHGMFDIVFSLSDADVLATYTLDTTPAGNEKLSAYGIPISFPAITRSRIAAHTTYYLSGNWAYSRTPLKFPFLAGVPSLMRDRDRKDEHTFHWNVYVPLLEAITDEAVTRKRNPPVKVDRDFTDVEGTSMISRTHGTAIQVWEDEQWKDLFIHGVNLGIAMPGKWFTDFPNDKALYYRWLTKIGELGANTLRIYTLLDPEFYHAFLLYNQLHPKHPLWLMQEIWPEEEPHGNDYLDTDYQSAYEKEIEHVIDAVHGNATIAQRRGRAWGTYTSDISPYVIGYLVGRELEPHEVEATDLLNAAYSFTGDYVKTKPEATPTEGWLAASLDYVLAYEEDTYGWQHPVAIVNWPTLDAIDHPSERNEEGLKIKESNDRITVDINHIEGSQNMKAGLFGAYHIYPNYPDFMNNDPLYDQYEDDQGRFRYGGYLKQFMEGHAAYPAVVAEFGLATGMGNAHASPDGYHHGSMTEQVQGEGIIRMFEAMRDTGYAGGIIFEWMDEWTKKTWTTEPYMIPYDRHILWHNAIDPEQNYGILAYEAQKPVRADVIVQGSGIIDSVQIRVDASFLHLDFLLDGTFDLAKERLLIGIDTYDRNRGELLFEPGLPVEAPSGMEYLVVIDGLETARLLAIPRADASRYGFSTYGELIRSGNFQSMAKLTNKARALEDGTPIPAIHEDSSKLLSGDQTGATNHWLIDGNTLTIRIPWGRINVSDPSSGTVLDDTGIYYTDPLRDVLATTRSEGIAISAVMVQELTGAILGTVGTSRDMPEPLVVPWTGWNQPTYRERLKESYHIIKEYFASKTER